MNCTNPEDNIFEGIAWFVKGELEHLIWTGPDMFQKVF